MTETSTPIDQPQPGSVEARRSFASDAFKLAGGATFAQVLSFLVAPILSRLFAPEAFGISAVFGSILQIITVVVCLRYEFAIMLPEKDEDAAQLLAGSLLFVGLNTVLASLAILVFGNLITQWLNAPELGPYLWMMPLAVVAVGSYRALQYWNIRLRRYNLISTTKIASSAGQSAYRLGAGFLGFVEAGPLIAARVIAPTIAVTSLARRAWREDRWLLASVRGRQVWSLFKRYRKFPLVTSWSGLLNTVSYQLPVMLLSSYFSSTVVGHYSFGLRIVGLPMSLIGDAISQVFFQRASEANNQGTLTVVVQNTYARLLNLGLFPMLAFGLIGPEAFTVVFGPEWAEAGVYTQILTLWRLVTFLGSPMSTLVSVLERQELGLLFSIVLIVTRIASLVLGGLSGDPRLALALYSTSGFVLYLGLLGWLLRASGASIWRASLDTARGLLYTAPALVLLIVAKWWWRWPAWSILLLAGMGGVVYYGMILRHDRTLLEPILRVVGRVWKR
jgi:O-antigen/teichoic acid export membrane protein